MVIFGVKVLDSEKVDSFIDKTNDRFDKVLFFKGMLFKFKNMIVVDMKPLLFPFYWLGLVSFITIYYFWGFRPKLLTFAFIVFCGGIFWTRYFFYFFLKIGIKKEGYLGKIKLMSHQDTLREVLYNSK